MKAVFLRGRWAIFFIGALFLSFSISLFAQSESVNAEIVYPEAGKPCPDFVLHNIHYYSPKEATLKDFSGKWLVLDFWNKHCGACIGSFPKVSKLQQQFGDKVQFMLVGIEDKEQQIEPMYAKFREKEGLVMPCAFDSSLAKRWDIYTAPYIIVINPEGVVQAITYSLSASDVEGFLEGHPPRLPKAFRVHEDEIDTRIPYDPARPLLIQGNGGADSAFLFRSLLSGFDAFEQHNSIPDKITATVLQGRFQVLGVPLFMLYNYAYYGKPRPDSGVRFQPVLDIKDSTVFQYSSKYSKELFCYSLTVPKAQANQSRLQSIMQRDLEVYFGYTAKIEEWEVPCWKLVATSDAAKHLQTKGGPEIFREIIPKADFDAHNWPFKNFLQLLKYYNGGDDEIIDETGITGNIDIEMHSILTDAGEVNKGLARYGLSLVRGKRPERVLVISDKP
jgi:thiol-disulfide isomerase/thioredoxin